MRIYSTLALILLSLNGNLFAQNIWTQKADFGGVERVDAIGFSIGTKGYIGTGRNSITTTEYADFWEFDPTTDVLTQKANFSGGSRHDAVGYFANNKGYVGTGVNVNGPVYFNDFWEYNPGTNIWIQKSNFAGTARYSAKGFTIGDYIYIGTGYDGNWKKDFWQYNTITDTWIQKTDFGGIPRYEAASFAIGANGYLGTGENNITPLDDFWKYDTTNNSWTQVADFAGTARWSTLSFSLSGFGYVGTGVNSISTFNDVWEYNPFSNIWNQVTSFGGGGRHDGIGFSIGNKGYDGTGNNANGNQNDFWEFDINQCQIVANYPFSGNANDVSGNANDGTVNGATLYSDRFGIPNNAYEFNGISAYISNNSPMTADVPFTITCWIKVDTYGDKPIYTFGQSASGLNQLTFGIYDLSGALSAHTSGANDVTSSNAVVPLSQWTHVAVVHTSGYNINSFKFYINGIEYTATMHGGANVPFPTASNGAIGMGRSGTFFDGAIDELKIYDCELNAFQIDSIYDAENYLSVHACDTLYYATTNNAWFGQTVKTNDGNIVCVGTENQIFNWSNGDIFLQKYDTNFNLIWSKQFYVGGGMDIANGVITTSDGGYLIHSSYGNSNAAGNFSAGYIIKTDSAGNQQWVQTLTGQSYGDSYGGQVAENSLGEFVCYGQVQHHAGCGGYSTRITKLSSTGAIIWSNCIAINPDWSGGFTKLESSDIYISVFNNQNTGLIELRKFDDSGNQIGFATYQFNNSLITSGGIKYCQSGGFFVYGRYNSAGSQKNAFIAKFDDAMNYIWETSDSTQTENYFYSMTEDATGNIYCTGKTNGVSQPGDLVVVKFNNIGVYLDKALYGITTSEEYAQGIISLNNGDVICSGRSDAQGLLVKFCDFGTNTTSVSELSSQTKQLTLFPNPASDLMQLTYDAKNLIPYKISIFNMAGQRIFNNVYEPSSIGTQKLSIPLINFHDGIYLIRLESGNIIVSKKLIISH